MKYSKLLGKNIASCRTPLLEKAQLTNRKRHVNVVLEISSSDFLRKKGCYLTFTKYFEDKLKPNVEIHSVKISKKEALELLQSELVYKPWRKNK